MKIVIDTEDLIIEEDDINNDLKTYIINTAKSQIVHSIREKVQEAIIHEIQVQVESTLHAKIRELAEQIIATDKIKSGRYSTDPEITLQEYITNMFQTTARNAPVDEIIKKQAIALGEEMKKRYDLLFASQLVAKLGEAGLMKEDAVRLLLMQ